MTLSRACRALALVTLYAVALPAAHAGAACLLFPLSCLKPSNKYGDVQEAVVLNISTTKFEHIESDEFGNFNRKGWSSLNDYRDVYVSFRVGATTYVGLHKDTNMFTAGLGYVPKPEEWIGRTFKMKFMDQDWLGLKGSGAIFTRPDGKEYKMVLMHIYGPDGVDQCGLKLETCPPQAGVDRAKVEAEQLEKVAKANGRRFDQIKPASLDAAPEVAAATAAPAATSAEPAAAAPPPASGTADVASAATAGPPAGDGTSAAPAASAPDPSGGPSHGSSG